MRRGHFQSKSHRGWTLIGQFAKKFPSCGRIVAKSRGELDIIDEHGGGGGGGGQKGGQ